MVDVRNTPYFEPEPIDYPLLGEAERYYTRSGYPYREVPWVVRPEAMAITLPQGAEATRNQYGDLVGSGEQSFIELMMRGEQVLRSCTITPCFRLEPEYDELHHGYFMKLELFDPVPTTENLMGMIACASKFFDQYVKTKVVATGHEMYDIVDMRTSTELGSYGFRSFDDTTFIYGTGLALPRLSTVMSAEYRRDSESL